MGYRISRSAVALLTASAFRDIQENLDSPKTSVLGSPRVLPRAEPSQKPAATLTPSETQVRLRSLAHDLSNSIETIMQAAYLLGQGQLDETGRKWFGLIDQGARDAARVNREIREILRAQMEKQK